MKTFLRILFACISIFFITGCNTSQENQSYGEGDAIARLLKREFDMTRDVSLNRIPSERLETARQYAEAFAQTGRIMDVSWEERGPNNVAGRTRTAIVDKRDATGNTVLAASVSGGIFRTTNFLSDPPLWAPVNDKLLNLAFTAMVQDTLNPNVMYAGTGEGWLNFDAVRGRGIFKSTDGGVTWNQLASTDNFEYVQDIIVDRNGNVYASVRNQTAAGARGVQRSTNGGTTWTQVLGAPLPGFATGRAADLELASNGDLYATLGISSRTQVLKSNFSTHAINTGNVGTWTDITPPHSNITLRGEISVAPSNPQRLYLMMQDSITDAVQEIYRSSNGGGSWETFPAPAAVNNGSNSQAWFNLISAVDPANENIVIVGGLRLARSTDGGATWGSGTYGTNYHVDQHYLYFINSSRLVVGNDGGVYYTANANNSSPAFTPKNTGYNITQFYAADYHPTNTNYFLAGSQDNGTQRFIAPGMNSTTTAVGGDGGFCHIDQTDGIVQVASNFANTFWRSINGGASFNTMVSNSDKGRFISPSDYDDAQNVLYASDNGGSYFVINNVHTTPSSLTVNLTPILPAITGNHQVSAVKVDPNNPNTVWFAASTLENSNTLVVPIVFKLTNANTSSPTVTVQSAVPVAAGNYVSSIDIDSANSNHLVITVSNYGVGSVFESTNGGTSWTNIEGNLPDMPVRWAVFAPPSGQLNATGPKGGILAATELGVWYTSQIAGNATQWTQSTGIPNVRTDMLKIRFTDNLLLAATHGRGLFTSIIPGGSTPPPPAATSFIKAISVTGNQLFIVPGGQNHQTFTIQIFDMKGSLVYQGNSPYQTVPVNITLFSSGVYIVRVTAGTELFTAKFLKR